jgi:hypothetical protein
LDKLQETAAGKKVEAVTKGKREVLAAIGELSLSLSLSLSRYLSRSL